MIGIAKIAMIAKIAGIEKCRNLPLTYTDKTDQEEVG
jgi:hypothetical protein